MQGNRDDTEVAAAAALGVICRVRPAVRGDARARRALAALLLLVVPLLSAACAARPAHADLAPTLTMAGTPDGLVAMQNGIPVPTFERQPRPTIDLAGPWRVEIASLDADLTLTARERSLETIVEAAAGRHQPGFDDSGWATVAVPGATNPPPERREDDAWYRRTFAVPTDWTGRAATLKFGAVNYVADVWLNGVYLGYHEGGYTPFAFDAGAAIRPGEENTLAVRVVNPDWGTRNDIVPWGLADWWNFSGITRDVWLEAAAAEHVARADVVPHLDGVDLRAVVANRGAEAADVGVRIRIFPAAVDESNLLAADASELIRPGSRPFLERRLDPFTVAAGSVARVEHSLAFRNPEWWSPELPALYVLVVDLLRGEEVVDGIAESFGLRHIQVDPAEPGILLNARPVTFRGAALHDQRIVPSAAGLGTSRPATADDLLLQLRHARAVNADLIRAGHTPPNPILLRLADRLGFAVWSEIPLYHYTPLTFDIALSRGIAQQMLREMALRDMNRPSVLFHGLANESTGQEERRAALETLHEIDREVDGTRLTGQAAYAFQPEDPTSEPLDIAGYTFYFGVFYGADAWRDSARALDVIHAQYPRKPVMVLEMGRWADPPDGERLQREILEATLAAIDARDADLPRGFVSAAVWWTLEDYWTMRPNIDIEHFGLYAADGRARPVAAAAAVQFAPRDAGAGLETATEPQALNPVRRPVRVNGLLLLGYVGFGLAASLATLGAALAVLLLRSPHDRR